jgi:hypothetical protein
MTTDLQNMGGVILFRAIIVSFISRVIPNWTDFQISVEFKKTKIVFSVKLEDMDKANQMISSETRFSNNMASLSTSKEERLIAQILATKFHTDPATEPESEVRLNPVMRDLIINGHVDGLYKRAVKKRWSKRQKAEIRTEAVESVGENQPVWLSTLREEITKME